MTHMANVDLTILRCCCNAHWAERAHCANSIVWFFGRSVGRQWQRVYGQTKASSDDYEHELTSKSMAGRAKPKWLTRMQRQREKKIARNDNDDGVNYFRWQTNRECPALNKWKFSIQFFFLFLSLCVSPGCQFFFACILFSTQIEAMNGTRERERAWQSIGWQPNEQTQLVKHPENNFFFPQINGKKSKRTELAARRCFFFRFLRINP